jgi:hypothetical protein
MPGLAFISYRRDDTGSEAQGLYLQLKGRFGSGQLFMDVNSVPVGSPWPRRVKDKLLKATVVRAMIGPGWLTASDQYGRRRLDFPDDWVHLELATALTRGTPIIPVVVGHKFSAPPPDALPDELQGLFELVGVTLRPEVATWQADMDTVARELIGYGLKDGDPGPDVLPTPSRRKARPPSLTEDQLNHELEDLPGWEPWEDTTPGSTRNPGRSCGRICLQLVRGGDRIHGLPRATF